MRKLSGILLIGAMAFLMTASIANAGCGTCDETVVEAAIKLEKFNTLVAAVKAADLVETLAGEGPFTILAPTDEAFEALPEGTVESLLKPENKDKLVEILTYHVIPGKVMSKKVAKLNEAKTLQGSVVNIKVEDGKVMINDAEVIIADKKCSNGVVHAINKVIMPSETK